MDSPAAKCDDSGHHRHTAYQMSDLQLFLKVQIVDRSCNVERLSRIALHVVRHSARLVDDEQPLAGLAGVVAGMVACLFQRLFDPLDLIADRLTKGLCRAGTHDLLMPKEGVCTVVHQHGAPKGRLRGKGQTGKRPTYDICQTQTCQIGQLKPRRALKDVDTGVCPAVCRADLRHIGHGAHAETIQHDHNKLSHEKLPFPLLLHRVAYGRVQPCQLRSAL